MEAAILMFNSKEYYKTHKKEIGNYLEKTRLANPYRAWACRSWQSHKSRGFDLVLTKDELTILAKNTMYCKYCGVELNYNSKGTQPNSASMDRIDSMYDNIDIKSITIICHKCNTTKGPRSHLEFVAYCKKIADKYGVF
jgi:hypothetical protein